MENKGKYFAVSLGLLVLLSAFLFIATKEEERHEVDPKLFSFDTETIDRVQLFTSRDTIDLSFDGSRWKVNGQWEADLQMIKVLMATIRQAEPHRPVAATLTDSVRGELEASGTRVVLSQNGTEVMRYLAGGNSAKTETWFLKKGDDQPYIMNIPGYRVYVAGIFQLEESGWRNKRVFNFNWRNFKSLRASFHVDAKEDFLVEMKQRYSGIAGMQADTTRLNDYLDDVSLLMVTRFLKPGDPQVGDAVARGLMASIVVSDIADRIYSLDLFRAADSDAVVVGWIHAVDLGDSVDVSRQAGGDLVIIDRDAIAAITRRRSYFVPLQQPLPRP